MERLILVAVVIAAVALLLFLRRPSTPANRIDPAALKAGPIRHPQLPDELVARVRAFEAVFAGVYSQTDEQWIDGFQRDLNPESEIAIWEQIASALTQFVAGRDLPLETRREAFGILLVRSGTSDEAALSSKLTHLTLDEAKKLVSIYSLAAKPLQIQRQ